MAADQVVAADREAIVPVETVDLVAIVPVATAAVTVASAEIGVTVATGVGSIVGGRKVRPRSSWKS